MCEEVRDEDLTPAQRELAKDLEAIGEAEAEVEQLRYAFLKKRGWEYTCRIGALWLWRKGTLAVSMDTAMNLESRYPEGITGLELPAK